jgi:hypothetical protein
LQLDPHGVLETSALDLCQNPFFQLLLLCFIVAV